MCVGGGGLTCVPSPRNHLKKEVEEDGSAGVDAEVFYGG